MSEYGRVDPEQEARWAKRKKECYERLKEMQKADKEAKRIAKIPDLEGRREALAMWEHLYGKTSADTVKKFLADHWLRRAKTRRDS